MNKLLGILTLTAALAFLPGCAGTPKPEVIRHIATATQIAAKDGTFIYVSGHADDRDKFQKAHDSLAILEEAQSIDFGTVLKIVQQFPIKELKNPQTVIAIQDANILLTDLGATIPLDKVNDLRPIVTALRLGIEQGLALVDSQGGGKAKPPAVFYFEDADRPSFRPFTLEVTE
jgi:hypothetical protein